MNQNQKGFANIILVLVVIVLAGIVGYFLLMREPGIPATQDISQSVSQPPSLLIGSKDSIEFWVKSGVEKVLSQPYPQIPKGSKLISVNISERVFPTENNNVALLVVLNFNKNIANNGKTVFDSILLLIDNEMGPLLQSAKVEKREPEKYYSGFSFEAWIEGRQVLVDGKFSESNWNEVLR